MYLLMYTYNIVFICILYLGDILYIRKFDVLILYVHLFWCLPEDGDLSLKHVGQFMSMDDL